MDHTSSFHAEAPEASRCSLSCKRKAPWWAGTDRYYTLEDVTECIQEIRTNNATTNNLPEPPDPDLPDPDL